VARTVARAITVTVAESSASTTESVVAVTSTASRARTKTLSPADIHAEPLASIVAPCSALTCVKSVATIVAHPPASAATVSRMVTWAKSAARTN
jgi:hypothetical protein